MSSLWAAFLAETVLITYRSISRGISVPKDAPLPLPLPSTYAAPILVYGMLGLVPGRGRPVAALFGWGLVVATLLNLWQPAGANQKAKTVQTIKPSLPQPAAVHFG